MNEEDAFMVQAEMFQKRWALQVSVLTGAVKEMTDQGWPEEMARAMVGTLYMQMIQSGTAP